MLPHLVCVCMIIMSMSVYTRMFSRDRKSLDRTETLKIARNKVLFFFLNYPVNFGPLI